MFDPNPNHFNTLNHGDMWLNNFMIKREGTDEGAAFENVAFIDFQDSCWTSPAIDLQYFLNTSLLESLRPAAFDELIGTYYEQLASNLSQLEYKRCIPTRSEFDEQFNARNFYGNFWILKGIFERSSLKGILFKLLKLNFVQNRLCGGLYHSTIHDK